MTTLPRESRVLRVDTGSETFEIVSKSPEALRDVKNHVDGAGGTPTYCDETMGDFETPFQKGYRQKIEDYWGDPAELAAAEIVLEKMNSWWRHRLWGPL